MKWSIAERMCYNKRRYSNGIQAAAAIGRIKAKSPEAALLPLRSYECPVCRGHHLTKETQDNPEYQKRRFMAGLDIRQKPVTVSA